MLGVSILRFTFENITYNYVMAKNNSVSEKTLENLDRTSVEQDEELAFIEYQEEVTHSREEKRNRAILVSLSIALYLLGLGIFAIIVQTVLEMNKLAGIIVGATLLVIYTVCFIVIIVKIFSKHSFDLEFQKRKDGHFSERTNNKVRWEIAKNIAEQSAVLDYLEKKEDKKVLSKREAENIQAFHTIQRLSEKYPGKKIASSHSKDSTQLAEALEISMSKDGVIYKKAKSIILKRSLSTGCLTALSQNTMLDASVVVVKNLQLVKDLIWLYGFRPTNSEMNVILGKVVKSVCLSIGLNTMQKGTSVAGKFFSKESNNFFIQLLGQALDMGAQFFGNGAMTYMVGKYTVNALLSQYRIQDLYRLKDLEQYEMEMSSSTIKTLNDDIKVEVDLLAQSEPKAIPDNTDIPLLPKEEEKESNHQRFHERVKQRIKRIIPWHRNHDKDEENDIMLIDKDDDLQD